MALITQERFNQVEWSRKFHNGKVLPEIEMLAQDNQVVMDIGWQQASDGTSHLYSQVTAMPTVSKTAYNEGDTPSKSTSTQETETTTMLSGMSEVAAALAKVGGAEGTIRAKEDSRFAEVMKQECAKLLIYGNRASNIRDIDGLAVRYSTLTGNKSKNVFSCGGGTANGQTSIYGGVWGSGLYGIVPAGTTAGYTSENLGQYVKKLDSGKSLIVKGTHHMWQLGLVQEDWRCGGRICNIEVADVLTMANNQSPTSYNNLLHKLILLKQRLDRMVGTKVLYCNDTIGALLMRLCLEKSTAALSIKEAITQFGTKTNELHWFNIPIRRNDQILNTEAVVG